MHALADLVPLLIIFGVVVVVIKVVIPSLSARSSSSSSNSPSSLPYRPVSLLTPTELSFMRVLEQAVGSGCRILTKVRMADVIDVKKGLTGREWGQAFRRIESKHLDFLICDADYSIICAIELDDSSHEREDRQDRDDFVNKALWSAGVRLVRFTVKSGYSVQEIQYALEKVTNEIPVTTTTSQTTTPRPLPPLTLQPPPPRPFPIPLCPFCGVTMVRRTANSGTNIGQDYWGCPNYPKCKGMLRV